MAESGGCVSIGMYFAPTFSIGQGDMLRWKS